MNAIQGALFGTEPHGLRIGQRVAVEYGGKQQPWLVRRYSGTVVSKHDPSVWVHTVAFPGLRRPTQEEVDDHIATLKARGDWTEDDAEWVWVVFDGKDKATQVRASRVVCLPDALA